MAAGTVGSIGTGLQVAGMVSGAFGSYNKSKAAQGAYEYQADVSKNNATLARWQAQDALQRGATSVQQQQLKTAQLRGSQRAAFAARGVALDEGSALHILDDTEYMGGMDARTIQNNANREAWGHRVNAGNYESDSSMLRARAGAESPMGEAFSTLLTGGGAVAESWYRRKRSTSGADTY
jgi:hypothetical protein